MRTSNTMPTDINVRLRQLYIQSLIDNYVQEPWMEAQQKASDEREQESLNKLSPKLQEYFKTRDKKTNLQKVLCFCFSIVYRKWLHNSFYDTHNTVLKVTGWRSALVATHGKNSKREIERRHMSPCFLWFN